MTYKSKLLLALFALLVAFPACSQQNTGNRLANETSPYLKQHASNPVDWYPWGEEALEKARRENKPIIVSIGYAACHWCHVMEEESFENEEVARIMNEHFVSIKVDREERPDIDQIYVDVAQIMTGSAGWPLNVITLPDTRPFFAGTYFPRESWIKILNRTIETLESDPDKLEGIAEQVTRGVRSISNVINVDDDLEFSQTQLDRALEGWKNSLDRRLGGYQRQQKFPLPGSLLVMFEVQYIQQDPELLQWLELTLDQMAAGGIYDHLGGGFARYSVDPEWRVPHFEKMLYDNAQLIRLYSVGYQVLGKQRYREIVEETIGFLQREMEHESGGYYSSIDADSEGEEGTYYVWTYEELQTLLSDSEFNTFSKFFAIEPGGNWEDGKNVLYLKDGVDLNKSLLELTNDKLLKNRSKRVNPSVDNKILTAWNAMLIRGYLSAYNAFGNEDYLEKALEITSFIDSNLVGPDGGLFRSWLEGETSVNGFLDDYAHLAAAYLDVYEATFDEQWLTSAGRLMDYVSRHFSDADGRFFYYTSDLDQALITRKQEMADNVMASSNSVMAKNLFRLGHYYFDQELIERSRSMLKGVIPDLQEYGSYYYNWFSLLVMNHYPYYEVAIVGKNANEVAGKIRAKYLPNVIYLGGKSEGSLELLTNKLVKGRTFIYVCRDKACKLPVENPDLALEQITYSN